MSNAVSPSSKGNSATESTPRFVSGGNREMTAPSANWHEGTRLINGLLETHH